MSQLVQRYANKLYRRQNMKYKYIFLIVFIILGGNVIPSYSQESREVRKDIEINPDGRLFIDTYKGSITIGTWDKPEVSITAVIESDGSGRREKEKVRDTEIRIRSTSDGVEIKSDYDDVEHHGFSFFGLFGDESGIMPFVHYTISMPSTARLKIKDYKSDTKIANLNSSIKLETYKGTVVINGFTGQINIETYKGDIKVDYAKYSDESRFETYKGKIELTLPRDAGFKLDADIGRRADFDSDFEINIKHKSRDEEYLRANVNGGGQLLRISTEKGDIRVKSK
jgi:hypothetical protein